MEIHQIWGAAKYMAMGKKKNQCQGIKNNNNINGKENILDVSGVRGKRK